jgi:benzodiazapine receptor
MSRRSDTRAEIGVLIGLLVLVAIVGWAGNTVTLPQIPVWYETQVVKPSFTPPNWLFGPVWTLLYLAMAAAAWLVWRDTGWPGAQRPWAYWVIQLALNLAWSFLFFGLHRVGWALGEIVLLFVAIALTIREFRRYSALAAWLMVPYLAWVGYAGLLNFAIWRLNQ